MLNWNQKIRLFAFKGISNKLVIKVVGMDSNVAHCMNGHKFDFQRFLRIVSDFFSLDFYFVSVTVRKICRLPNKCIFIVPCYVCSVSHLIAVKPGQCSD